MGSGCSSDQPTPPQNGASAPTKQPANNKSGSSPKPIDTTVLEDRRAELQRQIDQMERQLAASRKAFDQEMERQRQVRSTIAEQQHHRSGDGEDPALLALQSPKHPGTNGGGPPSPTKPATIPASPNTGRPIPQPNSTTTNLGSPQQQPPLNRERSASGAGAVAAATAVPLKSPARLNPLRQGSGSGAALLNPAPRGALSPVLAPTSEQSGGGLRRSSTTLPTTTDLSKTQPLQPTSGKSDRSEARKTLKPSNSSAGTSPRDAKQEQLDMMRGLGGGTKLTRTGTGSDLNRDRSAAAAQAQKSSEMRAGVADKMKKVQGLSANKSSGGDGTYLSRVPIGKLRKLNADDLKEIWEHYDADGNGYLDREELKKLATECVERTLKMFADQLREANPTISDEQLKKEVDKERFFLLPGKGDGKRDQTQDMIRMLVQKLDINKDGQVSRAELMMQWNSFSSDLFKERTAEGSLDCTIM